MMALIQFGGVSGAEEEEEGRLAGWGVECVSPPSPHIGRHLEDTSLLDLQGMSRAAGMQQERGLRHKPPSPPPFAPPSPHFGRLAGYISCSQVGCAMGRHVPTRDTLDHVHNSHMILASL